MKLLFFVIALAVVDPRIGVLATESRWVHAIETKDAGTLAGVLAPNFVHVNYRGVVTDRQTELELVTHPKRYTQHTSGQTVTVLGTVAVVHGVNTITQAGTVVLRLRYTRTCMIWKTAPGRPCRRRKPV